jgi:hypothetical protein
MRGTGLTLNLATSSAGSVQVEIQNPDGQPIDGFALDDCPEIFGDGIERIVTWKGSGNVGQLSGKPIRLRFLLKDADLHSFQFRE